MCTIKGVLSTHSPNTHLSDNLLEFGSDDLSLLVFGCGGALSVPAGQLGDPLQIQQSLEAIDVVIH